MHNETSSGHLATACREWPIWRRPMHIRVYYNVIESLVLRRWFYSLYTMRARIMPLCIIQTRYAIQSHIEQWAYDPPIHPSVRPPAWLHALCLVFLYPVYIYIYIYIYIYNIIYSYIYMLEHVYETSRDQWILRSMHGYLSRGSWDRFRPTWYTGETS